MRRFDWHSESLNKSSCPVLLRETIARRLTTALVADSQRSFARFAKALAIDSQRRWSRQMSQARQEEDPMDWNRVEGNWKQIKGKVKEQWGKLTDDDLDTIDGKQEQLEGKLQQRYGYQKDQAKRELNDWYGRQKW